MNKLVTITARVSKEVFDYIEYMKNNKYKVKLSKNAFMQNHFNDLMEKDANYQTYKNNQYEQLQHSEH